MSMLDFAVGLLLLLGGGLCLLAGVGIVRLPDLYNRMQAATKAGTLGVACIVLAAGLYARSPVVLGEALLVVIFFFLTSPVASHLVARAAYTARVPLWKGTCRNDMPPPSRAGVNRGDSAEGAAAAEG